MQALNDAARLGVGSFSDDLDKLFKKDSPKASLIYTNLIMEYFTLFLYQVMRASDYQFGQDNAAKIQSALLPYIVETGKFYYDGTTADVLRIMLEKSNKAMEVYSQCEYRVSDNENSFKALGDPKAVTVQFRMRIAQVLELDYSNPLERWRAMKASASLTYFSNLIDLDEWLKGPAMKLGIKQYSSINLEPPSKK